MMGDPVHTAGRAALGCEGGGAPPPRISPSQGEKISKSMQKFPFL